MRRAPPDDAVLIVDGVSLLRSELRTHWDFPDLRLCFGRRAPGTLDRPGERPLRITERLVDETIGEMNGILERAPLDTRVAWRDLFQRVDVDSRELKAVAVAVWNATTENGVNRSNAESEWLRRTGAGRVLNSHGVAESEISLPRVGRSREWLKVALVECARCQQVVERTSPIQRYWPDCAAILGRERSRECVRRRRRSAT